MPRKEEGITHYTKRCATVIVGFPNGDEVCSNCEYCWEEKGYIKRCRCRLLHDDIIPIDYVNIARLPHCPLCEEVYE